MRPMENRNSSQVSFVARIPVSSNLTVSTGGADGFGGRGGRLTDDDVRESDRRRCVWKPRGGGGTETREIHMRCSLGYGTGLLKTSPGKSRSVWSYTSVDAMTYAHVSAISLESLRRLQRTEKKNFTTYRCKTQRTKFKHLSLIFGHASIEIGIYRV